MKIGEMKIPVREVFDGYADTAELGVRGYGGRLNIRPAFQREFVYNAKQRAAVVDTVRHGFPLNVMYWVRNAEGGFEMLDGQQRTLSICQYVNGDFSIEHRGFANLTEEERAELSALSAGTVDDMFENHRRYEERRRGQTNGGGRNKPERKSLRERLGEKKREAQKRRERDCDRHKCRDKEKDKDRKKSLDRL